MVTIQERDNKYFIYQYGKNIGTAEFYDNPYHMANRYVKLNMQRFDTNTSAGLFSRLKKLAGRPLQVMVDSENTALTKFLLAGGFVCKRKCYEVKANSTDYIGGYSDTCYCSADDLTYKRCCHIMYDYYTDMHKAINPWTADYTTFCAMLPSTAIYAKVNGNIFGLAFIEDNEIAYVCGTDKHYFPQFARSLASSMLAKHGNIFFECDDCDWAAMMLRALFANKNDQSFDTYIYS